MWHRFQGRFEGWLWRDRERDERGGRAAHEGRIGAMSVEEWNVGVVVVGSLCRFCGLLKDGGAEDDGSVSCMTVATAWRDPGARG